MIIMGGEDDDPWWYLQQEGEEKFIRDNLRAITSIVASAQGEQRAAALKSGKQDRLTDLAQAIAPMLAKDPSKSNKSLLRELRRLDAKKYKSNNTARMIGQIRNRSR